MKYLPGLVLLTVGMLALIITGCGTKTTPISTTSPVAYSEPELRYRLLSHYSNFFWCDPDLYPVARPELPNALDQFPAIQANTVEFSAIISHLGLPQKSDYTDAEKLEIYREHKKLTRALQITGSVSSYIFSIRTGEGEGELIEGTITSTGNIKETSREPSVNICPICLAKGTLIDAPVRLIPVEEIEKGMTVWSMNASGNRVPAVVIAVGSTPVPRSFQMVELILSDGRSLTASPGHPTADSRLLGDLRLGDMLDGAAVVSADSIAYDGGATFDLLPAGETGLYFANGILLKSTLRFP